MKNILYNLLIGGLYALLLTWMILKVPQWHSGYIRYKVGSRVVKVTNEVGNSGGTGVHIKVNSGKTYILTNDHVCGVAENGIVFVSLESSARPLPKKIIEHSNFTDLCLIEGIEGVRGLSLGSEPYVGDTLKVIGHPLLQPNAVTEGEIFSKENVSILSDDQNLDNCTKPKNKIENNKSWFGDEKICTINIKAYKTTIHGLPGNSGSPAVDMWGNIVALAFAGDRSIFWLDLVAFEDIQKFIQPY